MFGVYFLHLCAYFYFVCTATSELVIEDTDIKWETEDFGTDEIPEELQDRLLEQYEAELQEKREKRKSLVGPVDEKVNMICLSNTVQQAIDTEILILHSPPPFNLQAVLKADQPKSSTSKTPESQAAPQKPASAGKKTVKSTNTSVKQTDSAKAKANTKTKSNASKTATKKPSADNAETNVKSLAEDLKTDAGAASDESWEKDFDLNDP